MENKTAVVSAVERGGRVRSQVSDVVTGHLVGEFLAQHVSRDAHLHTDESILYRKPGKRFASHNTVKHREEEYVRYEGGNVVTTNAIEGFFGNTKRSIDGTHHQVSRKHLPLYLAEIDYKYNTREETDGYRTALAVPKIVGKRLMLRRPSGRG